MANQFIATTDVSTSIIVEDAFGTTPTATPAVRYELPTKADQAPLAYSSNKIASDTRRPGRASNGSARGMGSASGSFDIRFQKAPVIDRLIESATGGRFDATTNILKAGADDLYFTTLAMLREPSAAGAADGLIQRTAGCAVTQFQISAQVDAAVTSTFTIVGATRYDEDSDNPLGVTVVPNTAVELSGENVKNVTVAGQTLSWSKVDFSVQMNKTPKGVLGQRDAVNLSNSGNRAVTVTLTAYRESFEINEVVDGSKQPVVLEFVDEDGKGYRVTLPAAQGDAPNDDVDGDNLVVVVEFTAAYDETQGTDLVIERL